MRARISLASALMATAAALLAAAAFGARPVDAATVDPWIERALRDGADDEFCVVLADAAAVKAAARSAAADASRRTERVALVREALVRHAERSQAPLVEWLDRHGVPYTRYHVVNALLVRGDAALMRTLAQRSDVARIEGNPRLRVPQPTPEQQTLAIDKAIAAVEPGIAAANAPAMWTQGFTGQGIVVGGQDTGATWAHPALKNQYRGWNGSSADHNYNWHDSIHATITFIANPCGYNAVAPCDDGGHGTHTLGTAGGSDGGSNQIGMAPGAKWIACRNMDNGVGRPSTYLECFEWLLAPYPVGATTAQGDPSRAPHVTVNSWACPPGEGCSAQTLQSAVEAHRAAGIMTIVSAGNEGPGCNTVADPPAIYDASYSVAAYSVATGALAAFSSRGPVSVDGSNRMKPDITAPGVNVRSAYGAGYASLSGTSMAGPHVAGAVALLWSARPSLKGDVASTEQALNDGAHPVALATTTCGSSGSPNALWGFGTLDVANALAAVPVTASIAVSKLGSAAGTVTSSPPGIACGATCAGQFAAQSPVVLSATPAPNAVFTGWLGACTGTGTCTLQGAGNRNVSATFASDAIMPIRIDIDGDNRYDGLTDGLMIVRFLFGLTSDALVNGATSPDATRSEAQIVALLSDLRPKLDLDANAQADALTDGLMLIRYLFGIRGAAMTNSAIGSGATRTAAPDIESYIATLKP